MSVSLVLPLLLFTGLFAGLIDSMVDGGGLITIPVLSGVAMPPRIALGVNKLPSGFASGSAMITHIRENLR